MRYASINRVVIKLLLFFFYSNSMKFLTNKFTICVEKYTAHTLIGCWKWNALMAKIWIQIKQTYVFDSRLHYKLRSMTNWPFHWINCLFNLIIFSVTWISLFFRLYKMNQVSVNFNHLIEISLSVIFVNLSGKTKKFNIKMALKFFLLLVITFIVSGTFFCLISLLTFCDVPGRLLMPYKSTTSKIWPIILKF